VVPGYLIVKNGSGQREFAGDQGLWRARRRAAAPPLLRNYRVFRSLAAIAVVFPILFLTTMGEEPDGARFSRFPVGTLHIGEHHHLLRPFWGFRGSKSGRASKVGTKRQSYGFGVLLLVIATIVIGRRQIVWNET